MFSSEELRALITLLRGEMTTTAPSAEGQRELLLRGVVSVLEEYAALHGQTAPEDGDALTGSGAVDALRETAAGHPVSSVRSQAFQALLRLAQEGSPAAVDALYRLEAEHNLLAARQAILTQGWQPTRPSLRALFDWFSALESGNPYPEEGLALLTQAYFEEASPALQRRLLATAGQNRAENWARIISAAQSGVEELLDALVERYPQFRPAEREITLQQLTRLAGAGSMPARRAMASLFIRHEDTRAAQIVLENRFLPDDPIQQALLFFLVEDWQQYERLDFDHSLLVSAYEQASRILRRRLLEHSRYTGQMDWLRGLGVTGEVRWLNDLTDADWELTLRRLLEADKPADLWRLAQVAPPIWSAAILARLAERGWQPEAVDEREGFALLAGLAQESLSSPLTVRPRKSMHAPATEITCLAMHPNGRTLAAGTSDQPILQWNLPEGNLRVPALIGPALVTRAIAYSPDGELLTCANGDNRIRAFRAQNGQLVKTFDGHRAMIRGLAIHPDGRALYSASFDGSIRFWRFPHGAELNALRPGPGEIFSLAMGANGSHLLSAGADSLVHVWTLPEGTAARELVGHTGMVTLLAASAASELVASAGRDEVMRLWNYSSGGLLRTIPIQGPLTALCLHPNDQVLIGGASSGQITLWNLSTGRIIDQLHAHDRPITGLVLSPEGDRLYSADSAARLQVWDLQIFLAVRLAGELSRPGTSTEFEERLKKPDLSSAERKWLKFMLQLARWRQRFDIELDTFDTIQVGEFDIELG